MARRLLAAAFGVTEEELVREHRAAHTSPWRMPGVELNGAFTPDDESRLALAAAHPSRVDAGVIQALSDVLAGQRRLEDAMGPAALLGPVGVQTEIITGMYRQSAGHHRPALGRLVAEWTTFTGWLHAATRLDTAALAWFGRAEEIADEIGYGAVAAQATSFRGYVARQQGRHRAVVRAAAAAAATPGTHPAQHTYDVLQQAQALAVLGDAKAARGMLDEAARLVEDAGEPPSFGYWYTPPFFRLNIGVAKLGLREYRDAVDLISDGLSTLPAEQRQAEWVQEYEKALAEAGDRA